MIIEKFILNVDNQLKFFVENIFLPGQQLHWNQKTSDIKNFTHRFGQKVLMFKIFCLKPLDIRNYNMVVKSVFSKNSEILKVFINKKP